jgi:putative MATE family efflux protein
MADAAPPVALPRALPAVLLKMAVPVVLANLAQTLMGLVDTLMVGRLGAAPLAAVGLATLAFSTLAMALKAVEVAVQTFAARWVGAGRESDVGTVLATAVAIVAALSLLLTAGGYGSSARLMGLLSTDPAVRELGVDYLWWRLPGLLPLLVFFMVRATFDGIGWTGLGMLLVIGMNLANVGLNWVLIFGKLGAPALGVVGAALASTLSGLLACGGALVVALRRSMRRRFRLFHRHNLDPTLLRPFLRMAWPAAVQQLGLMLALLVFFSILGRVSTVAVAAGNVVLRIGALAFMPGIGVAVAVQTVVGQALGAGDPRRAARAGWTGVALALLLMGGFGILFLLVPGALLRLFTTSAALVSEGTPVLRLVGLVQVCGAFALSLAGALRGAGETRAIMLIDMISGWLFFLPASYLFGVRLAGGLQGAFYGFLLWFFLYAVGVTLWFVRGGWRRGLA